MSAFFVLDFLAALVECLEFRWDVFLDIRSSLGVESKHQPGSTRCVVAGFGIPNSYVEYQLTIDGSVSVQYGSVIQSSVTDRELRAVVGDRGVDRRSGDRAQLASRAVWSMPGIASANSAESAARKPRLRLGRPVGFPLRPGRKRVWAVGPIMPPSN